MLDHPVSQPLIEQPSLFSTARLRSKEKLQKWQKCCMTGAVKIKQTQENRQNPGKLFMKSGRKRWFGTAQTIYDSQDIVGKCFRAIFMFLEIGRKRPKFSKFRIFDQKEK